MLLTSEKESLLAQEESVLKKIVGAGFCNPYDDFAPAFQTGDNKRYVKDFLYIDYGVIEENQVSVQLLDKKRCKEELLPLIELEGLKHPPIVEESVVPGKFKQVTGHHRAYTMDMKDGVIPVIVATKNYNLKGDLVPPDIDIIQGVRSNPAQRHHIYTMDDAVYVLSEALRRNPDQSGLNPTGKLPPRYSESEFDFDDFMNRVMGTEYFPYKATRTKIHKSLLKGAIRSKLIDIDFKEQTDHLTRIGWDDGLRPTKKTRKESTEHFDTKRSCMIVMSDNNGRHLDEKMLGIVKLYHQDSDFCKNLTKNGIRFIDIIGRVYKPPTDQTSLDSARDNFKKSVTEWKSLLKKMNVNLTIRKLVFPKQLLSSGDKDTAYTI